MFKLKWPDHPSPFWFGAGRKSHIGRVRDDGYVDAESDRLQLLEGELPPPGTELRITKERPFLVAETIEEYSRRVTQEKQEAEKRAKDAQETAERALQERQIRAQRQADEVNSTLRVPVPWTSGLKTVLSGLSANSSVTGDNARSVTHILLLESIDEGRFNRPKNSFLCTSASGSNGQAWTGKLETHSDGVDGPYVSEVTCKQCLKLAERWVDLEQSATPVLLLGNERKPVPANLTSTAQENDETDKSPTQPPRHNYQPLPEGVPLVTEGTRTGTIDSVTADHVIQNTGGGARVAYLRTLFPEPPVPGQLVKISCHDDKAIIAPGSARTHSKTR